MIAGLIGLTGIAGCANTESGFATVTGSEINIALFDEANGNVSNDSGLVAFVTGTSFYGDTYKALSGIRSDYDVGTDVGTGEAVYVADYAYYVIDDIQLRDGYAQGTGVEERGQITITADFDDRTISGTDSALVVGGNIYGGLIEGVVTAIYSDPEVSGQINGDLQGYIGDEGIIAAFHGNDPDTVMAGGLVSD